MDFPKKHRRRACRPPFQQWLVPVFAGFFLLNGCAPKLDAVEPPIEQPEEFSYSGTQIIPDKWWTAFNDPVLDTLVEKALGSNLDLTAYWYQFEAALATVRGQKSFLYPEIDAVVGTDITRPERDFTNTENLEAGISASYEVDLWGRIRSGVEAEKFRAQATFYDYQSAAITLSAETSLTWYELVAARQQLELVERQIETNEDILRLIRARFTSGQIRAVDILRQEQLLESTRNQQIFYETEVRLLQNELAVLLGTPPQNELILPEDQLPALSPLPETGLPLELIRRRPDVQQVYHIVLAADREMAQAIRAKYPRLSLSLNGDVISEGYNSLFQDWAYTLAGNLVAPLFYGGRIRAEVDRSEAVKNQRIYEYGQTVLNAFQEVENALIREKMQEKRLEVLERQLELLQKTNIQLRREYLSGLTDYLDVLLSLDQEQQLQRDLIEARLGQVEYRIALYRALAGGFEPEGLEAERLKGS